jgi:hypothetical protein
MRTLFHFILVLITGSTVLADQVILHWNPNEPPKPAEGIIVWVRDDGRLLSDSGLRTIEQLLETCKSWRKQGTEPRIRIVLFPRLESNLNLGLVWPLMSSLKEEKIGFELLIADADAQPEDDLITGKRAEQGVTPQSATRPGSDSEGGEKPQPESDGRSQ